MPPQSRQAGLTRKLLLHELKTNAATNIALAMLVLLSAILMASGAIVIERFAGSIDRLFAVAKPPHLVQMHVGELGSEHIERVIADDGRVTDWTAQLMADVPGIDITYHTADGSTGSMSDSMLDNYFVAQNTWFDHLLDMNNQIAHVASDQIGLPIVLMERYGLSPGDRLTVRTPARDYEFTISTPLRDAQMASSMASSTRFLVADDVMTSLANDVDSTEWLLGFMLTDASEAASFQDVFLADPHTPQNGPTITAAQIRIVNTISDGLLAAVVILASVMMATIALINVRFTLLATMSDQVREIGTLKAIGIPDQAIKRLYRLRYVAMSAICCLLGALVAFPVASVMTGGVATNYGLAERGWFGFLLPFIAVAVVHLIVVVVVNNVLRRVSKMSAIEALRGVAPQRGRRRVPRLGRLAAHNLFIGFAWQRLRWGSQHWRMLAMVFVLTSMVIALPLAVANTLASPDFIRYQGATRSDLHIECRDRASCNDLATFAETDAAITELGRFETHRLAVHGVQGWSHTLVTIGDYDAFPIVMSDGQMAVRDDEIALSAMLADHLGVGTGESLTTQVGGQQRELVVTGVYQDISNGGMTAKTTRTDIDDLQAMHVTANIVERSELNEIISAYQNRFDGVTVFSTMEFASQTLGTVTASLNVAVVAVVIASLGVAAMIALLFIRLQTHREFDIDAITRSLGSSVANLRASYVVRCAFTVLTGVLVGVLIALTLGEMLIGGVMAASGFGITELSFILNPGLMVLLAVVAPAAVALVACWLATSGVRLVNIRELGYD